MHHSWVLLWITPYRRAFEYEESLENDENKTYDEIPPPLLRRGEWCERSNELREVCLNASDCRRPWKPVGDVDIVMYPVRWLLVIETRTSSEIIGWWWTELQCTARLHLRSTSTAQHGSPSDGSTEKECDVWIDLSKLGTVFSHEGSNLYLRAGALGMLGVPFTQRGVFIGLFFYLGLTYSTVSHHRSV
jgi:hypothetical protein